VKASGESGLVELSVRTELFSEGGCGGHEPGLEPPAGRWEKLATLLGSRSRDPVPLPEAEAGVWCSLAGVKATTTRRILVLRTLGCRRGRALGSFDSARHFAVCRLQNGAIGLFYQVFRHCVRRARILHSTNSTKLIKPNKIRLNSREETSTVRNEWNKSVITNKRVAASSLYGLGAEITYAAIGESVRGSDKRSEDGKTSHGVQAGLGRAKQLHRSRNTFEL